MTLNLKDETHLQNKEIKIGALKLDTQGDVQLENSNVVLYSAKGDVTENISKAYCGKRLFLINPWTSQLFSYSETTMSRLS